MEVRLFTRCVVARALAFANRWGLNLDLVSDNNALEWIRVFD